MADMSDLCAAEAMVRAARKRATLARSHIRRLVEMHEENEDLGVTWNDRVETEIIERVQRLGVYRNDVDEARRKEREVLDSL